jgi:hypothetical protein
MPLPLWALPFKKPHTEIKLINGSYYKYQISYRYDPTKKHTVKKSGAIFREDYRRRVYPLPKTPTPQGAR